MGAALATAVGAETALSRREAASIEDAEDLAHFEDGPGHAAGTLGRRGLLAFKEAPLKLQALVGVAREVLGPLAHEIEGLSVVQLEDGAGEGLVAHDEEEALDLPGAGGEEEGGGESGEDEPGLHGTTTNMALTPEWRRTVPEQLGAEAELDWRRT